MNTTAFHRFTRLPVLWLLALLTTTTVIAAPIDSFSANRLGFRLVRSAF